MTGKRILVVEDDATLIRMLRDNLVYEGFTVECASDGGEALAKIRAVRPDLVLLDLMIPTVDGFEICRLLGASPARIPIVVITARTQREDKVRGLELGADDYIVKPFALDELLARIRAVLRRSQPAVRSLTLGDVAIDFHRRCAFRGAEAVPLTAREFALLEYLAERAGKVVTRSELLRAVWGYEEIPLTRTVDIFVGRLRRKLERDPHQPRYIRTMHGDGYSLIADA
jgi:two-component system alkaline phosphatase synthesis response regulator PhoP